MKLQGKIDLVSNLADLELETGLLNLELATRDFLLRYTNSGAGNQLDNDLNIRAYRALKIPVPILSGGGFVLHHALCREYRGRSKEDWIWVRRHPASDNA